MERKSFSVMGLSLVAGFAVMYGVNILLLVPVMLFRADLVDNPNLQMILSVLSSLAMLPVVWLILRKVPRDRIAKSSFGFSRFLGLLCAGMGVTYILNFLGGYVNLFFTFLLTGKTEVANPVANLLDGMSMWSVILQVCIVAPLVEEFIFRKMLLDCLRPFGDRVALLYSAIAFGLFHMNLSQIFYAAGMGLIFGYIVLKTGNIWYGVALHACVNFLGSVVPLLVERYGGSMTESILSVYVIAFILSGVALIMANIRRVQLDAPRYSFSVPISAKIILVNAGGILYLLACAGMTVFSIFLYA
jgi:membrane protease YdiL (CAAX protease family)